MKTLHITTSGDYLVELKNSGDEVGIISRLHVTGTDNIDINLTIIHAVPNTSARTSIKAVVDGRGRVNLKGTIIVRPGAQNTNSFLEERVLLLSQNATAEAVPNLEIEANDVKCSHAATIGQIDQEQLFYLQSRGLTTAQAKSLIAQGFLR
jgi:Fe-S cluster assembly protein SufD